ncbi:Uncharacterised protein [Flavobacterium hibernum]|nr:Uncharacterised protein [Flavobacterium hibernum]
MWFIGINVNYVDYILKLNNFAVLTSIKNIEL